MTPSPKVVRRAPSVRGVERRTKVVATVGPASDDPATLTAMIAAGMDMARMSLSHGTPDETLARIARVRQAADAAGKVVGVLADLPGPKIRAAEFPEGGVHLPEGATLELVPSNTALATSLTSARVGTGARIIDSSICVAVITGRPYATLVRMMCFW